MCAIVLYSILIIDKYSIILFNDGDIIAIQFVISIMEMLLYRHDD